MRRTLWYGNPSGEWVADPSVEDVLAQLRADEDSWGWANPMVELRWDQRGRMIDQLLIIRHPDRGFYLEYSGRQPEGWAVAVGPSREGEWVALMCQGEQASFLGDCFLPLETTEQVVREFVAEGSLSAVVRWVPFEELEPRRNDPPRGD